MAACKLASQGKTMADSSYVTEVESLKILLSRQQPALSPALAQLQFDVNVQWPKEKGEIMMYKTLHRKI
jgi:hypothetical protein